MIKFIRRLFELLEYYGSPDTKKLHEICDKEIARRAEKFENLSNF
jgi:hypothetical protein